ncbi:hypothetical protein FACS1894155_08950 [Bacteroidia bacterium]|nr:hypothetical protein FACS1894155_08950 [Bacteroidia bacterium]
MFNSTDLSVLNQKGINISQIEEQLEYFKKGFPFLPIVDSASINKGIIYIPEEKQSQYLNEWETYRERNRQILKFVPASGAASRMFKDLFEFLDVSYNEPKTSFEKKFFDEIEHFAFFESLNKACIQNEEKDVKQLVSERNYKTIVANLLQVKGLNYGFLPKGLLEFHRYPEESRTAMEEHLAEGAMYASNKSGMVHLHFTVSPEHRSLFENLVKNKKSFYEKRFGVKYDVSFSEQKSGTDTLAVDENNQPFRENGLLLFRPGGHGALIQNMNDLDADIVFIKNIDNVVPDHFKSATILYKQLIAGILVYLQRKIFNYLHLIESGKYTHDQLMEMLYFLQTDLCIKNPEIKMLEDVELVLYIKSKLNRPLRICGMVKNEGEPGGGPFLSVNPDGTISLQILESSQVDLKDPVKKELFDKGTHFNPVDLVCSLKNHHGEKYDLLQYVDKNTGFISGKSKNGKNLKALELPGLWNGAMSDWNTVFVEVPIQTFNPVKTVNDLLRPEHQ